MSYHSKRRISNIAVYTILTLVVVSVICVTVFTFVSARKRTEPEPVLPGETDEESSPSEPANASGENSEILPTVQPAVSSELPSESPKTSDMKPTDGKATESYCLPTDGYVMKECSIALPVWSETMQDYRAHTGIDISAAVGTQVVAIANGLIREITDEPMMGHTVRIEHDGGLVSVYQNLMAEETEGIAVGMTVSKGQVIGAVGESALAEVAESDHLHFELYRDGALTDPCELLDFSAQPKTDRGGE